MSTKAKILFVSESGPLPAIDGKRQRTLALLQALETIYDIDYLVVNNDIDYNFACQNYLSGDVTFFSVNGRYADWRSRLFKKAGLVFARNPVIFDFVKGLASSSSYEFIFCRYIAPAAHIPGGHRILCDVDDDFSEMFLTRISNEKRWTKKFRLLQIYALNYLFNKALKAKVSRLFFVKETELMKKSILLPNLPFQVLRENIEFATSSDFRLLFVGKLSYRANAEGLKWFITEVLPIIRKAKTNIRLSVVSSDEPQDKSLKMALETTPDIDYIGRVGSIQTIYKSHSIVIAPIFSGGGSNIKIAEALLMGRPVITTTFGSRGFEVPKSRGFVFSVRDVQAFKDQVLTLLNASDQLIQLQERIHSWARGHYSLQDWRNLLFDAVKFS